MMNKVKLIIWDLDETLWQGTLAEHDHVQLNADVMARIQYLLNRGIVHSICSKNEEKIAEKTLTDFGIHDLFIFPKISFDDKGLSVRQIIEQAQLRPQNVLVIDDNPFVLREIRFHNPDVMTQLIGDFMQEDVTAWGEDDPSRKRLSHYKILENKQKNKSLFLKNNDNEHEFLKTCSISIELTQLNLYDPDIERVIELVNRANQLNFTQSRVNYDYLFTLFELKNGVNFKVNVRDNYGDYGIVGYVCILNNTLLHFVFSCRTLGMCVEARVYQWLKSKFPSIKTPFNLGRCKHIDRNLDFISVHLHESVGVINKSIPDKKILVRGPCLANAMSFLLSEHYHVDEEIFAFFEYANLDYLRRCLNEDQDDVRFEKTTQSMKNDTHSIIINFLESDYYSGLYKLKNQRVPVASNYIFWKNLQTVRQDNQLLSDYIEAIMMDGMLDVSKFNLGASFSPWPRAEKIANLSMHWFGMRWQKILYQLFFKRVFKTYCGFVSEAQFEQNLRWYIDCYSDDVKLVFINPPEKIALPLLNDEDNIKISERTYALNEIVRGLSNEKKNVCVLEMNNVIKHDDIIDSFSHLKRQGYIKLSQALCDAVKLSEPS